MATVSVLSDIDIPDIDGHEVAQWIRASHQFDGVFLNGADRVGQEQDRQRAAAPEFDPHVAKPPHLERLQQLVAAARSVIR